MRATTLRRNLLGVTFLYVQNCEFDHEGLIVDVVPSWRVARCSGCGKEEQFTYAAQKLDQTRVSKLMRVAWRTVGEVAEDAQIWLQRAVDLRARLSHSGTDDSRRALASPAVDT